MSQKNVYVVNRSFFEDKWIIDGLCEQFHATSRTVINEELSCDAFLSKVLSSNFFDTGVRLFIIKKLPSSPNKLLLDNLAKLHTFRNVFIFNTKIPKKINDILKDNASYFLDTETINYSNVNQFIAQTLERYHKKASEKVISSIISFLLFNRKEINKDTVYSLFEKLSSYTGKRKEITIDDFQMIAYDYEDFVVWDLLNYLDQRDYVSSCLLFNTLKRNARYIEHEIVQILNTMIWKYRLSLFISSSKQNGKTYDQTWEMLSQMLKFKFDGQGEYRKATIELNKDESQKSIYSQGMFSREYKYCKGSPDFYGIVLSLIEGFLIKIRTDKNSSTAAVFYFDLLLSYICGGANYPTIKCYLR